MSGDDGFAEVCDDRDNALRMAREAVAERDAAVKRAKRVALDRDTNAVRAQRYRKELKAAVARADKAETALRHIAHAQRNGVDYTDEGCRVLLQEYIDPARAALGEDAS